MAQTLLLEDSMATTLPEITGTSTIPPVSPDAIERFEELAQKHGWSLNEAMRRALDITEIVLDAKDQDPNAKVYVYRDGKRYSLELQK